MQVKAEEVRQLLLDQKLQIRRSPSGWWEAKFCPFCKGGQSRDERTFVVNAEDGNYICKRGSCAQTGTFWGLCLHFGVDPKPYHVMDNVKDFKTEKQASHNFTPPQTEMKDADTSVLAYLHARGFSDRTIQACRVRSDGNGNVVFPYLENGETVLLKFRHAHDSVPGERKAWREKGGKAVLWGLDQCDPSAGPLVICFGEYDRMAAYEAGVSNTTSVPSGDADKTWIDLCWAELERYEQVILWVDNDKPDAKTGVRSGERALHEIAPRLGRARVRVVSTPAKDANELLLKAGPQAVADVIERADWYPHEGLIRVADVGDRPNSEEGVSSGLRGLDAMTGGNRGGEITVHTGDSGAGKTSGLVGVCAAAIEEGQAVCVWSGELDRFTFKKWSHLHMAGREFISERVSQKTGATFFAVDRDVEARIALWHRDKYFLYDRQTDVGLKKLIETFELAYKRYGCTQFVVDNMMALMVGGRESEKYAMQRDITAEMKAFAVKFDAHVHIVAHINKGGDALQPPTKDHVSGAKEITNLADLVVGWWKVPASGREMYAGADGLVCLLKNRWSGEVGNVALAYDKHARRFAPLTELGLLNRRYGWAREMRKVAV